MDTSAPPEIEGEGAFNDQAKLFASRRKASTKENMAQTDSNRGKHAKNPPQRPAQPAAGGHDGPEIGFNELRQACEISALREDLARLGEEAEALCEHIESAVEQVRDRVAGLCAEELADPDVMAPLLQFAVATLIGIRDRARETDIRTGVIDDAARPASPRAPSSLSASRPPISESAPPETAPPPPSPSPPRPSPPPRTFAPPPPLAPLAPAAAPAFAPAPVAFAPPPVAFAPAPVAPPRPSPRQTAAKPPGSVDWLGPARK
jgi:hypothetical protein